MQGRGWGFLQQSPGKVAKELPGAASIAGMQSCLRPPASRHPPSRPTPLPTRCIPCERWGEAVVPYTDPHHQRLSATAKERSLHF